MLPTINHDELPDWIQLARNTGDNLLIVGEPGIGKTVGVKAYCKTNSIDLVMSHPCTEDPTDSKGLAAKTQKSYMPVRDTQDDIDAILRGEEMPPDPEPYMRNIAEFLPFGDLLYMMDATKPTVWFWDDFGQAPASVQAAKMQLLGSRELNGMHISDHVQIIAATNGREHKAGVKGLLEPVKSRFGLIVELKAQLDPFRDHYLSLGLPHIITDFLNFRPEALSVFNPNLGMEKSPNPRLWEKLGRCLQRIGVTHETFYGRPEKCFAGKVCSSAIGELYGRDLFAFGKVYPTIPSFGEILADPDNFPLDQKLDVRFAMLGIIASKAKLEHADKIFRFILRLDKKYQTVFINTLSAMKSPLIKSTPARKWTAANLGLYMNASGKNFNM